MTLLSFRRPLAIDLSGVRAARPLVRGQLVRAGEPRAHQRAGGPHPTATGGD